LGIEIPESAKEYAQTLSSISTEMGLESFFSSFPDSKLKEFIKACELKVDSESMDTYLTCLIQQESIKAEYKGDDNVEPSKNKPDIDKDITPVDLYHHYFRDELFSWCLEHKLSTNGSKKELVERIRRFFDGKLLPNKDLKKERPKRKRSSEDDETSPTREKSDKSEKPEKPEKSKRQSKGKEEETEERIKHKKRTEHSDSSEEKDGKKKKIYGQSIEIKSHLSNCEIIWRINICKKRHTIT